MRISLYALFQQPTDSHRAEYNVQYEAEMERLNHPIANSLEHPESPRYFTRKAARSTSSSGLNQAPIKITSQWSAKCISAPYANECALYFSFTSFITLYLAFYDIVIILPSKL